MRPPQPVLSSPPRQLSASPKLTALAAAQEKPIPSAQAERLQLSRVPVQAVGGRKHSSERSGFFVMAEKYGPSSYMDPWAMYP